jgi:hypothetical protein
MIGITQSAAENNSSLNAPCLSGRLKRRHRKGTSMRNQGRIRLGYFPLPLSEARRIRAWLHYPTSPVSTIDPCIGDGAAFLAITAEACARRYGIELDAYRAEQAAAVVDELIHGDCLDVHCPVESCGLAFLNPPYDYRRRSKRTHGTGVPGAHVPLAESRRRTRPCGSGAACL